MLRLASFKITAFFCAVGFLSGCTGIGSVGLSLWAGTKCQAILDWTNQYQEVYPGRALVFQRRPQPSNPPYAYLFQDHIFDPVFGNPYTEDNKDKFRKINTEIVINCLGQGGKAIPHYKEKFEPIRSFLDYTLHIYQPSLYAAAQNMTTLEQGFEESIEQIEDLSTNKESYNQLVNTIIPQTENKYDALPASYQQKWNTTAQTKRKDIAREILQTHYADLDQAPNTMDTLPRLQEAMLYAEDLAQDGDPLAARIRARKQDIIQLRLTQYSAELAAIPLTVEGRAQSLDWVRRFEAEFRGINNPEATSLSRLWIAKRDRIYKVTKKDFMRKLDALPTGPKSKKAHRRLMAETFPMKRDFNLNAYQDYWQESLKRQKPIAERVFESTTDTVGEGIETIRKRLKEAAKDLVR